MKIKLFVISVMVCGLSFLSGCASLNSSFDCPMKPEVMCESLDQVNTQVDQGILGNDAPVSFNTHLINKVDNPAMRYSNAAMNLNDSHRANDPVMRIWIAPYKDKNKNYYDATFLYTPIKPGYGVTSPAQAVSIKGNAA